MLFVSQEFTDKDISSLALKLMIIRWVRTGYHEKSYIASYYRQFSTNIKVKLIPLLLTQVVGLSALTGFDLLIFHFNCHKKLSIIRCNKTNFHLTFTSFPPFLLFYLLRDPIMGCRVRRGTLT